MLVDEGDEGVILPYHILVRASALQNNQGGTNDDMLAIHGDLNSVESVTLAGESLKRPRY